LQEVQTKNSNTRDWRTNDK